MTTYLKSSFPGIVISALLLASPKAHRTVSPLKVVQHIQQIADVEADIERFAIILNLQLFLRLFLLAVIANDAKVIRCQNQPHAAKFFIR